jgi:hypothetical protein
MVESRSVHLVVEKHVMNNLKGTNDYGIKYASYHEIMLQGFTDSDCVGNVADRKSTSGCCFSMVLAMIAWFNKK